MIVSGFTQNRHVDGGGTLYGPYDHPHCMTCMKRDCSLRPDDISSCRMVDCARGCPARFHACKEWEHVLLCAEERVACINQGNGCTAVMARSKLAAHLARCPASVVFCTAEWNRAPLCPPKAGETPYLPKTKKYVDCGQLDVALAMRDQRALIDMLQAPRRTRRILRNPLTQRYPAAPFGRCSSQELDIMASEDALADSSDDDTEPLWNPARPWLGARGGVYSPLYQASRQTATTLSTTLDLVSNHITTHRPLDDAGTSSSANVDVHVTSSVDSTSDTGNTVSIGGSNVGEVSLEQDNVPDRVVIQHVGAQSSLAGSEVSSGQAGPSVTGDRSQPSQDGAGPSTECSHDANSVCTAALASWEPEHVQQTGEASTCRQSGAGPSSGMVNIPLARDGSVQNTVMPSAGSPNITILSTEIDAHSATKKTKQFDSALHKADSSCMRATDVSTLDGQPLHELLGVNLGVECITKYQPKQSYMYTFLCGQEFRRDQFPHHFHNVHNEIQSGLSGWMEQRCPLAYLGCPFSFRRFCPDSRGMSLCHSWLHESFGLRSEWPEERASHQTPQCLMPESVEHVDWSSNVDRTREQSSQVGQASNTPLELSQLELKVTHRDLLQLEPKGSSCESSRCVSAQILCHGERSVDVKSSAALTNGARNVTSAVDNLNTGPAARDAYAISPTVKSCNVDTATTTSLPSASRLSDKTDSFALLLDGIVLDACVDSRRGQPDKTAAAVDEDGGHGNELTPSVAPAEGSQDRQCEINKMGGNVSSDAESATTDEQASSTCAVGSPSSNSVLSLDCALLYASLMETDEHSNTSHSQYHMSSCHSAGDLIHEGFVKPPVLYTGASPNATIRLEHADNCSGDQTASSQASCEQLELADLPIEILHHIARFLDSFSLYNLSLVSRQLRDICCGLLDEMGIVSLMWERKRSGTGVKWHVAGKRWSFSLSFQTVHKWRFTGHNPISPHLLTCPYNRDRLVRTERFSIIPQNDTPCDQQIRSYLQEKEKLPNRTGSYRILPTYIPWTPQFADLH